MRGKFSPPPPGGGYSGFQVTVLILAAILSSPLLEIGSNFLSPPPSPPPPSPWEFKTNFYYLVAGPYLYATASTLKHSYLKFTKDQQQNIE